MLGDGKSHRYIDDINVLVVGQEISNNNQSDTGNGPIVSDGIRDGGARAVNFANFARLASDQDTTRDGLNLKLIELENVQGMGFNDVQNRIHAGQVNLDELNENSDLSPK